MASCLPGRACRRAPRAHCARSPCPTAGSPSGCVWPCLCGASRRVTDRTETRPAHSGCQQLAARPPPCLSREYLREKKTRLDAKERSHQEGIGFGNRRDESLRPGRAGTFITGVWTGQKHRGHGRGSVTVGYVGTGHRVAHEAVASLTEAGEGVRPARSAGRGSHVAAVEDEGGGSQAKERGQPLGRRQDLTQTRAAGLAPKRATRVRG